MEAKRVSLWVKVAMTVVAIVLLILKGVGVIKNLTAGEITAVCGACVAFFIDVSVNTGIDKFKKG